MHKSIIISRYCSVLERLGKKTVKRCLIAIMLLTGWSTLEAQAPLSLSETLEKAYLQNLSIEAKVLESTAQSKLSKSVGILPKTNIALSLGQMNTVRFDENLSISQSITNPAYRKAQRQVAEQQAALSKAEIAISKQDLQLSISKSWYAMLYWQELKRALLKEDSLLQEFVRAATLRFDNGDGTILEKMSAENKQQQLRQTFFEVETNMVIEMLKIKQLAGLEEDFTPLDSTLTLVEFELATAESELSDNPILRYLQMQARVTEAEQNAAKKESLPDFQVGYFIQSFAGPMDVNGQNKDFNAIPRFQGVSLGISVPIFGGPAYKAKSEGLGLRIEALKKEQASLQSQLESRLQQLLKQYDFYQLNLKYYQETALPNSDLLVKYAVRSYKSGESDYVAYLQALQISLDNRKAYWAALLQLNQTLLEIQYLAGGK
jgi:cobalt-zinc-cadmium resistance protein CzcA